MAQSSTESGARSHESQMMSRHSSSELSGREGRRRGGSSEHLNGRGGRGNQYLEPGGRSNQNLESGYDQHTFPRGHRVARGGRGEGIGRGGTLPPPPHRYGYDVNGSTEDCIPMIEYPDINGSNHSSPQTLRVPRQPSQPAGRGRPRQRGRGRAGPPPQVETEVDYYPQEGSSRNGYIKYNSMAAARY